MICYTAKRVPARQFESYQISPEEQFGVIDEKRESDMVTAAQR